MWLEDHKTAADVFVNHSCSTGAAKVDAGEGAFLTLLRLPQIGLLHGLIDGLIIVLVGAFLSQTRDAGLGIVPVATIVLVEIGGLVGETAQGIAEGGDAFAGLGTAQFDAGILNAFVGAL